MLTKNTQLLCFVAVYLKSIGDNLMKIYFAHPVNMYGEPIESAFEKLIAHNLTNDDISLIENPNQPQHQVGYDKYARRLKESGTSHKGMSYFYDEVLPNCSGCAGVPFLDGRLGLGVAGEMKWFIERDKPVWIAERALLLWAHSYAEIFIQNPQIGLFIVRPLIPEEVDFILSGDPKFVVPHEETRLRTWKIYNKERRPYEEAHLVSMPVPEGFYPQG